MCKAIQEWIAEEREEERVISEERGEAGGEAKIVKLIRKKYAKGLSIEEIAAVLEAEQNYIEDVIVIIENKQTYTDEQIAMEMLKAVK